EKLYLEVVRRIMKFIEEGDGYRWIYKDKNSKKNSLLVIYHCNCHIDRAKRQVKHPNPESQRDTPTRIERYNCEGTVKIEVFASLNLIKIKYSHLMLHPRPIHIATSLEIQEFIKNNINYLVPELYHQIKEKQLKNFTIQQTYFWWSKESQGIYQRNSDPLISAKLLLAEFNQEIIVDLSTPTPALGFLTTLFYKLPRNNFSAIVVDATFGTNKMGWELYALMGVIDGTGFPLSYLLIAAGKNRNITSILSRWMYTLKCKQLENFPYKLMDKDFCEINAAQKVWPDTRLQLCFWHVVHAIKQRIASRKPILDKYDPIIAYRECSA
ncbi:268_t:CDS:1, partial [Gigaspora rosea]